MSSEDGSSSSSSSSSTSVSGVVTFVLILAAGPCFYGSQHLFRKFHYDALITRGDSKPMLQETRSHRLQMESSEYVFALLGYSIGIGNVWRFPYVIAQNGGGAALVAYLVCTILVAAPIFLYEQIVGQYTRMSTIRCYHAINPRWTSLGIASGCMLFLTTCYYGMVVTYSIPYLVRSMQNPLPWIKLGPEEFWFDSILNSHEDIMEDGIGLGPIQPHLAGSLFAFWLLVFLTCGFGKHWLEKVTYVTVILPIVLMTLLIIRSIFLPGSGAGLAFYLCRFDPDKLLDPKVWAAACGQILFSLSPGFGSVITYSSFVSPKEDVVRACKIVAVSNMAFSILAGLATFSILGHLALQEGLEVEEIAKSSGAGLAFITLAGAMQYFGPFANVISVLFFFMILLLGLDSVYPFVVTLVAYVDDFREEVGLPKKPSWQTSGLIVSVLFLLGLTFTTRMGFEVLSVVDHFVASIFLLLVVSLEAIMFNIDFGWHRMNFALTKATHGNPSTPGGRSLEPSWLCRLDFHATTTVVPAVLGIYLIGRDLESTFGGYPTWLVFWFGWFLLIGMILVAVPTLWRKGESSLPPYSMHDLMQQVKTVSSEDFDSGFMEAPSINIAPRTSLSEVV
jgi:NSS family neurotransmitter:Na+ symporter